jgi:hypothetical protein
MARAFAAIDREFCKNKFLRHSVRYALRHPEAPATLARYGVRVCALRGRNIDSAIRAVNLWLAAERKSFGISAALGRGSRLPIMVLEELALILRMIRLQDHRDGADRWRRVAQW